MFVYVAFYKVGRQLNIHDDNDDVWLGKGRDGVEGNEMMEFSYWGGGLRSRLGHVQWPRSSHESATLITKT